MAKGLDKHRQRQDALALLGKTLARRAGSKCELCETGGQRLLPFEVPPVEDEPDLERTLLLCERCREGAEGGKLGDASTWRFLESVMWSELAAVQVVSIRLLRRLAAVQVGWAQSALETVFPSAEVESWLGD